MRRTESQVWSQSVQAEQEFCAAYGDMGIPQVNQRKAPQPVVKVLAEFDRRARCCFGKTQFSGMSTVRALCKKLTDCSGLQARDYGIIATGLAAIVGFDGAIISDEESEKLTQSLHKCCTL